MRQSRKKKRSKPQSPAGDKGVAVEEETQECKALRNLMEVFSSVSLEEATSAYREANGDPNRAAEILVGLVETTMVETTDDQGTSCSSSSSGSTSRFSSSVGSSSDDAFMETHRGRDGIYGRGLGGSKQKKVIAASGTVSTVLGKEYVSSSPRKGFRMKGHAVGPANKEDSEQFLTSMLGEDCELSMAVIRDVLCQCGYDVEKALDALLELAAPSFERSKNGHSYEHFANKEYARRHQDSDNITDRASDSTSHSSESDIQDNVWPMFRCRNFAEVLTGSKVHTPTPSYSESELSQKVLDSLFNTSQSSQREPNNMNWKDVVKKMESLGHRFASDAAEQERVHGKADEYQVLRKASRDHWDTMKSYYQKAATAFSNGEKEYATYLSEQGRSRNNMAREADEKASHEIFKARNKAIENVVTIDLHGQHVKQAMRLLKVHLLFGVYASSVQVFRVITGCGSHGVGKSKLKQAAINLIEKEGINWSEENRGTILIKLDGRKEFSFLESESDSD